MRNRPLRIVAVLTFGLLASLVAFAHSALSGSLPKNNAVLTQSPPTLQLTFKDEVRLTSVTISATSGAARKLEFTPVGSAKDFSVQSPKTEKTSKGESV